MRLWMRLTPCVFYGGVICSLVFSKDPLLPKGKGLSASLG